MNMDTYDLLSGLKPDGIWSVDHLLSEVRNPGLQMNVTVKFDGGISGEVQGKALLAFEKHLRQLSGKDIRVFKDKMGDDSKLRVRMTPAERDKL